MAEDFVPGLKSEDRLLKLLLYTYDAVGNPTVIEDANMAARITYTYDAKSRLTRSQAGGPVIAHDYAYSYDATDNRLTASEPFLTTYTYDLAGQILTSMNSGGQFITYTYDQNGSLSALAGSEGGADWGEPPSWSYDKERRVKTWSDTMITTTYTYDGDGQKRTEETASGTTVLLWDGFDYLGSSTSGTQTDSTYTVEGAILGVKGAGDRLDIFPDALGSNLATTDPAGASRLSSSRYKPYGGGLFQAGPTLPWQWVGTLGYRATGIAYMEQYVRARHYGATQASWLTVDPLWPFQPRHRYTASCPTSKVDPDGLLVVTPTVAAGAIAMGLVAVGSMLWGLHCLQYPTAPGCAPTIDWGPYPQPAPSGGGGATGTTFPRTSPGSSKGQNAEAAVGAGTGATTITGCPPWVPPGCTPEETLMYQAMQKAYCKGSCGKPTVPISQLDCIAWRLILQGREACMLARVMLHYKCWQRWDLVKPNGDPYDHAGEIANVSYIIIECYRKLHKYCGGHESK